MTLDDDQIFLFSFKIKFPYHTSKLTFNPFCLKILDAIIRVVKIPLKQYYFQLNNTK